MLFKRRHHEIEDINEFNININNLSGTFQMVAQNLVVPFATIFAKRLEATDLEVALVSALPAIFSIAAIIPGALFIQKCGSMKNITGRFFMAARMFFFLFALSPVVPQGYRAPLFVFLYGLMNIPGSIALMSWQSFIAGLFPPHMRARAMAQRNKISTLVGVLTTIMTGWLLYNIPKSDAQRIMFYQFFFAAAFLFSIAEIYLFYKQKEPESEVCLTVEPYSITPASVSFKSAFSEIRENKRFVSFCLTAVLFHFAWYLSWPLFPLYEIDYLHSNEIWTSILSATTSIFCAIAYPYWGKIVEKKGNSLPLAIAVLFMSTGPLLYPMSKSLYLLIPICAVNAIGYAGMMLIMLNSLYELSPEHNRTIYIAFFSTMTNLLLSFSPFVGIAIKNAYSIQTGIFTSAALRILAAVLFYIRYKKEKGTSA